MMIGLAADTSDRKVLRESWAEPPFPPPPEPPLPPPPEPPVPPPRFLHRRPHHRERDALGRKHGMKGGSRPLFSGTHLASFAPCVHRNLRRSQVRRLMFSRAYK
jgi:hypothetical protein